MHSCELWEQQMGLLLLLRTAAWPRSLMQFCKADNPPGVAYSLLLPLLFACGHKAGCSCAGHL
jgi:hypothetical protein